MHALLLPSFASTATRLQDDGAPAPYMLDAQRAEAEAALYKPQTRRAGLIARISRLFGTRGRVLKAG